MLENLIEMETSNDAVALRYSEDGSFESDFINGWNNSTFETDSAHLLHEQLP